MKTKIIPCPACKKSISDAAEACPKCGHPISEQDREAGRSKANKRSMGCAVAMLIILVLAIIGNMGSKDKAKQEPAANTAAKQSQPVQGATDKPTFRFTSEDIVERFNQAAREMDFPHHAVITKRSGGDVASSVQVEVGKHVAMVITTPNGARNASMVMLVGAGDGTIKSGAAILEGMLVLVATLSPELEAKERGAVLRDLGLLSGKKPPKAATYTTRGKVKYGYNYVDGMGTFFGADATN